MENGWLSALNVIFQNKCFSLRTQLSFTNILIMENIKIMAKTKSLKHFTNSNIHYLKLFTHYQA